MRILFPLGLIIILLLVSADPAAAQTWNFQAVDDGGDVGYQSQLAVASDGTPYILYLTGSGQLRLASWVETEPEEGGWDLLIVDTGCSYSHAIEMVIDSNDRLHLAWSTNYSTHVNYAAYDPDTKTYIVPEETFTTEYGDVDLALFESGGKIYPAIAYVAGSKLKVATRDPDSGIWTVSIVYEDNTVGYPPSIAYDSSGDLHISFYESTGANLMYATNANPTHTWVAEYVDLPGVVGRYSSIVLDAGDIPYIVYYDATNTDLKYAKLVTP
jgi:hypothetical protein